MSQLANGAIVEIAQNLEFPKEGNNTMPLYCAVWQTAAGKRKASGWRSLEGAAAIAQIKVAAGAFNVGLERGYFVSLAGV